MSTSDQILHGSCHCGKVSYTITIPSSHPYSTYPRSSFCHCTICRHTASTLIQAWYTIRADWVTVDLGEGAEKAIPAREVIEKLRATTVGSTAAWKALRMFASSSTHRRGFCGLCGAGLFVFLVPRPDEDLREGSDRYEELQEMDVTLGSLTEESLARVTPKPASHGWWGSAIEWVKEWIVEGELASLEKKSKSSLSETYKD